MSLGSSVYSEIFVYVWRQSFLYLDETVQNPNVSSFWRDETERKEKCFNFTHRYKSLNYFKPSVTWGEEFFNIWKQRLEASNIRKKKKEASNMSDKKVMKIVVIFSCSISCNQSFCFVALAWRQRTSVNVIVSRKLMKFLPVSVWPSKVGALITGNCRKCILIIFFFHCEILTL